MPIFKNDVTLCGNIVSVKKLRDNLTRFKVEVPFTDKEGEVKTQSMNFDISGDKAEDALKLKGPIEDDDKKFSIFAKAILIQRKATPDGEPDKKYHVLSLQADDYKGFTVSPGKIKGNGFCDVIFAGRVMRNPELRTGKNGAFTYLSVVYNRPGADKEDEKGTFVDIGVFGNSAEKYVCKYVNEGDFVLCEGRLVPRKERFKVKGNDVWGLGFNAASFAGVQAITPAPKGGGGGGGAARPSSELIDDDDIPF
jgi:single-stranded DNA-binding protein